MIELEQVAEDLLGSQNLGLIDPPARIDDLFALVDQSPAHGQQFLSVVLPITIRHLRPRRFVRRPLLRSLDQSTAFGEHLQP